MSTIILSAKSANDWTVNELTGFNIKITTQDAEAFFGRADLPPVDIDPTILQHRDPPPGALPKPTRLFFRYLRDAMQRFPSGAPTESAVDDFATFLLGLMGYDEPDRVLHQRLEIGFVMCGTRVGAKPDICVLDDKDYLLLVQEDKRHMSADDAEPQLIAEALAAFYENNRRRRAIGSPEIASKVFPGIILRGTAMTFYKIHVTASLLQAVSTAQFPREETLVYRFIPPVPNIETLLEDGMKSLENRHIIFSCLGAFKQFV